MIVSKSVGNAVMRHHVARRIRAAFDDVRDECPTAETSIVVRALPSAVSVSSDELAVQLRKALRSGKVRRLIDTGPESTTAAQPSAGAESRTGVS